MAKIWLYGTLLLLAVLVVRATMAADSGDETPVFTRIGSRGRRAASDVFDGVETSIQSGVKWLRNLVGDSTRKSLDDGVSKIKKEYGDQMVKIAASAAIVGYVAYARFRSAIHGVIAAAALTTIANPDRITVTSTAAISAAVWLVKGANLLSAIAIGGALFIYAGIL